MKKKYGILLIAVIIAIIFLTFQDSAGTVKLSENLRLWLENIGIHSDFHSFRSNAHLVVFFILGIALGLYGCECGWRWRIVLVAGCGFGLLDEGIKILLPTRELDITDLLRDFVGVALAVGIIALIRKIKEREAR